MDADFSYKKETDAVIGSAFDVLNEIGQMLNYLRITGLPVGLILNFKNPRLEFRRVVATTQKFIRRKAP
jgi:hypothetical protein